MSALLHALEQIVEVCEYADDASEDSACYTIARDAIAGARQAPEVLEALKALLAHSEKVNTAFYGRGTAKAMREAMEGQRELLQQARAAIASVAEDRQR